MQNDVLNSDRGHCNRSPARQRGQGLLEDHGPARKRTRRHHNPSQPQRTATTPARYAPTRPSPGRSGNSVSTTVAGTALNAEFTGFDWHHDGSTAITFTLKFSEEVDTNAAELKDHALTVTGGTVETVVQKDENSTRRWDCDHHPLPAPATSRSSWTLPSDCALDGHICTAEGELLAEGDWKTSVGPPVISVADATVTEGDDAALAFAVTLDRKWNGPIPTVRYSTSDGTATAGSDYTAASGTLTLDWTQTGHLVYPWALTGIITVPRGQRHSHRG